MQNSLRTNLLKNICGEFIEDFLAENNFICSEEQEFTINLADFSILLLPYLVQWIEIGDYAVELLLLDFKSMYECVECVIWFISVSNFQITNNRTHQITHIILTKNFIEVLNEFSMFYLKNAHFNDI